MKDGDTLNPVLVVQDSMLSLDEAKIAARISSLKTYLSGLTIGDIRQIQAYIGLTMVELRDNVKMLNANYHDGRHAATQEANIDYKRALAATGWCQQQNHWVINECAASLFTA